MAEAESLRYGCAITPTPPLIQPGTKMSYENPHINQVAYNNWRAYLQRNHIANKVSRQECAILSKLSFVDQLELVKDCVDNGLRELKDPHKRTTHSDENDPADYARKMEAAEKMGWYQLARTCEERGLEVAAPNATPSECIAIMERNGVPDSIIEPFRLMAERKLTQTEEPNQ